MGVLAVEMEAAALYMNAARLGANALAMVTVSDDLVTGGRLTVEEREKGFSDMIETALNMVKDLRRCACLPCFRGSGSRHLKKWTQAPYSG